MDKFFNFKSVVVFGVSDSPFNLAVGILNNLKQLDFQGKVYAIGSKAGDVDGLPIYTSLDQIEGDMELAVLVIPAKFVPDVMEACGNRGIRRVIIESSGFSEFEGSNKENDKKLLDIAEKYDMRFIGPNCIGTVNVPGKISLDFSSNGNLPKEGPIGVIAQSGGVTLWFAGICAEIGLGMTYAASIGNKLNVNEVDLIEYYIQSDKIGTVLCYLEGLSDGRRLMDVARRSEKPVVIYKSNTSAVSASIASSHTTAVLSDNKVVDQAFRQSGIYRVKDTIELDIVMRAFQLKPCRGKNIFVIARSGGHAVMSADAAARYGFNLMTPPKEFYEKLEGIIPTTRIDRQNPLDIGDVFDFSQKKIIEASLELEDLDALVFLYMVTTREEQVVDERYLKEIELCATEADIPVIVGFFRQDKGAGSYQKFFDIPIFQTPDNAMRALSINYEYYQQQKSVRRKISFSELDMDREKIGSVISDRDSNIISPSNSLVVANSAGVSLPSFRRIESGSEILEIVDGMHYPLVLKLDAVEVSHKSDHGFVCLNLKTEKELLSAQVEIYEKYKTVTGAEKPNLLVMEQAESGVEVIVGARYDETFGPVVMFGLGGIFVEVLNSVAMRICPIDEDMALEMIEEVQGSQLFNGYRGNAPVDKKKLSEIILRTAQLIQENPDIMEIDFNPVIITEKGAVAVDARIITR